MARDSDDDLPRQAAPNFQTTTDLGPLSLAELDAYISALEEEISRARNEIAMKQRHRSGVDSLFRR